MTSTRPARSRRRTQRAIRVQTPQVPSKRRIKSVAAKRAHLAAGPPGSAAKGHSWRLPLRAGLLSAPVRGGRLQEQRSQRRQSQSQAVAVAVGADLHRLDAAEVALAAPSAERRVAVEQLQPPARLRDADL